ncbi:MAG: hypothetical protein IKE53_06920 [Clostridiales bacterium]|nr:hypothetical protein [Clostridiales bacterium]
MNEKIHNALKNTLNLILDKYIEYSHVPGMEQFISFLSQTFSECCIRLNDGTLADDWLEAVCNDIRLNEYICKANAGLLTEEEAQARRKRLEFFLGPCDLPEEVK